MIEVCSGFKEPFSGKRRLMLGSATRGKKRVCIVTPEFPPDQWGGLARTVGNVAWHARDMGLDVHVAHLTVQPHSPVLLDENRETYHSSGITVHHITVGKERIPDTDRELWDCPHTLTLQMMYQSLEKLHHDVGFDLFHSFFLYPVGFVAGMLARRMSVPSIVTVVGNDVKRYVFSPEKVAVCRSGLENADCVVGVSRDLIEMADALTPVASKARVIYNSVAISNPPWINRRDAGALFRIGCAGIFKYAKGLPYLFKAVARIAVNGHVALELMGKLRESEQRIYTYMVEKTGIQDILMLRPPLPHERVPEWLRSLDLFVLPSVTEGCPNILMEAMACGVPCVATRTGAVEDLMGDRASGLLVPWGDSAALAAAVNEIIENPHLAESLGAAARTRMADFSPEVERQAWEEVYRGLMEF